MSDENSLSMLEALLMDHDTRNKLLEQRLGGGQLAEAKAAAPVAPVVAAPPVPKAPSVRHFMLEKSPTDDVQRTLTIGYFLEKHADYKSFNAKDIEKGFVEAREKVPGNVSDKVLKNVWKGTMMQVQEDKDGLKAYVLTNAGTKFVESGFKQG